MVLLHPLPRLSSCASRWVRRGARCVLGIPFDGQDRYIPGMTSMCSKLRVVFYLSFSWGLLLSALHFFCSSDAGSSRPSSSSISATMHESCLLWRTSRLLRVLYCSFLPSHRELYSAMAVSSITILYSASLCVLHSAFWIWARRHCSLPHSIIGPGWALHCNCTDADDSARHCEAL